MAFDISEAIDASMGEYITVQRTTGGGYVNGLYVDGSSTTFPALAVVSPTNGKALEMLDEGERSSDSILVTTSTVLYPVTSGIGQASDEVVYAGDNYKIAALMDWTSYGYNIAIGVRVE